MCHGDVMLLSGEALDPPPAIVVMLHKPVGYVTTSPSDKAISDPIVYDLLPYRRVPFYRHTDDLPLLCLLFLVRGQPLLP